MQTSQTEPPLQQTPVQRHVSLPVVLGIVVGVAGISLVAGMQLSQSKQAQLAPVQTANTLVPDSTQENIPLQPTHAVSTFEPLGESQFQAFAFTKEGVIQLIPIDSEQQPIPYEVNGMKWGGGSLGYGESDPASSPDLRKVAYLDQKNHLHLLSADAKSDVLVSDTIQVDYISGWSADSNKLIVHAFTETLSSVFHPYGPIPRDQLPKRVNFLKKQHASGFYLVDLEQQTIEYLHPLDMGSFISWIDADSIMVDIGNNDFAVFNTEDFQADNSVFSTELEADFGTQFQFSKDGKKWLLTWHGGTGKADSSNIVLADFPSHEGSTLMSGTYAEFQGGVISPSGKNAAFRSRDASTGSHFVYLYDGGETKQLAEGIPLVWVDDDRLIYSIFEPKISSNSQHISEVFLYDLKTQQTVPLN